MRVKRLQLENFRGFRALDLEFADAATTLLVGANASGKTSILDAIAISLAEFAGYFYSHNGHPFLQLRIADLSKGATRVGIETELEVEAPTGRSSLVLPTRLEFEPGETRIFYTPTSMTDATWFRSWQSALHSDPATPIPAIAVYPTERFLEVNLPESASPDLPVRTPQIYGETFVRRHDLQHFLRWYRNREDFENEMIRESRDYRDPQIDAVRRATAKILPGISGLRVRRIRHLTRAGDIIAAPGEGPIFTVRKDGVELRLSQLSHGEQVLFGLAGDLARRLAITNPGADDPLRGRGVVLIDEIELHLHPAWQREVIPRLEQAFPGLHFIVSTHSPQVLAEVRPEQVILLRDFAVAGRASPTRGRDANSILLELMGIDPYPRFGRQQITRVARLIDDERWEEARSALAELKESFGASDTEVLRLGALMEFLDSDDGDAA